MCPVTHLMDRNKFECTAKAKSCLYVLCWIWGSSVSSLTRASSCWTVSVLSLMLMPEYCGESSSYSAALSCLCSKENELPASLSSSHFFCTMLPKLVAGEAELPYLPLNWHGVTSEFSAHSNNGLTCWHRALSTCWHLLWGDLWGDCLSADPKLWNDS